MRGYLAKVVAGFGAGFFFSGRIEGAGMGPEERLLGATAMSFWLAFRFGNRDSMPAICAYFCGVLTQSYLHTVVPPLSEFISANFRAAYEGEDLLQDNLTPM